MNIVICFRLIIKNIYLILLFYFVIEEINMSFYLLFNIFLLVKVECKLLVDGSKVSLFLRRGDYFFNYNCGNYRRYLIVFIGLMWLLIVMFGLFLYIFRILEVRRVGLDFMNYYFFLWWFF